MIANQKSSTDSTTWTNCSRSAGFTQENTPGLYKKPSVKDSQIPGAEPILTHFLMIIKLQYGSIHCHLSLL
jgi:hypothetical protein